MKVLHAAFSPYPSRGVVNQMLWEQRAASELGIEWDVRIFCIDDDSNQHVSEVAVYTDSTKATGNILDSVMSWVGLRRQFYAWLAGASEHYDLILLRYSSSNPFQWLFLRNASVPVLLVHHTLELEEIRAKAGSLSKIQFSLERFFGKRSISVCHGTVGVTSEIVAYELDRAGLTESRVGFLYPNGIFPDSNSAVDRRGSVPEMVFVASSFLPWHGLDLLLDSIGLSDKQFVLHLVGRLGERDYEMAINDRRIIVHGEVGKAEISRISQSCWIGISSLALHRNNMKEACTLKVREYLGSGLPVYANYNDVFPDSFEFYRKGRPEIDDILNYALEMRGVDKKSVSESSFPYISKKHILEKFHAQLLHCYSESC